MRSSAVKKKVPCDGATLLLPGVGYGNVGQLALDVVLTTLSAKGGEGAGFEKVCELSSRHVLPVVGNDPLGLHVREESKGTSSGDGAAQI